ncbi:2-dehydro-3-deoxygalactonokinase [Fertoebacter nigrum]|uniref:2-dehydro-3-deoxygalactonokinase n=1 Tax=Fertoeibacter niger TaxID=2656921 RepID=A0A8X8KP83_9RHOB|nr:2-dehydro-3-deoxygalactonokinase [Fertoeibacter niger]NUB44850.1 2-dehydro-3-deoxygalactonokinase [Fertoeibacter niger]
MTGIMADWIAVDWGTTHLRAYAMGANGVLAEASSADGMGSLTRDGYEAALLRLAGPWLGAGTTPVVACGMVGSRQGWMEAPYRTTPCTPLDAASLVAVPTADARLAVRLVPGLKQAAPADVMRGEETQIAGALALLPGFDGILCLPGTHSKWVQVSAGEVVSFQTYMTGEMFALLSQQSVLRHGMATKDWDEAAFATALSDAIARPEKIAARLFALRAEGLIAGLTPAAARSRLSGLLIGIELAAARPYWLGQQVALIGADALCAAYAGALHAQGVPARILPAAACTIAGLAAARPAMEPTR